MKIVKEFSSYVIFLLLALLLFMLPVFFTVDGSEKNVSLVEIKYGELVFHRRNISAQQCKKELAIYRQNGKIKIHCLPYRLQAGRDSLSFIGGRYEK